jgi:hypothetical protein
VKILSAADVGDLIVFASCTGHPVRNTVMVLLSASRPQVTFVTRLQPMRLPAQAARQLPDQSTTLRVDSSSTDDSRLRGALPLPDSYVAQKKPLIPPRAPK